MKEVMLYHGSEEELPFPEIRKSKYTKDFSWGFYCTNNMEQAKACRVNNVYSNLFMVMFKYIPKIKDLIFHKK